MTTPSAFSSSPKFNSKLCKHLADKLKLAVESALSFIVQFNGGFRSPEERVECLDIFKLFHALANVAEDVIRSCCQDAWIQAAFLMTNASEHILSMSFDLEMLTHFFSGSLTSTDLVDSVFRTEVAIVKNKASQDRETLIRDVNALVQTKGKNSSEYQLADLLLKRLETRGENLADTLVGAYRTDMGSLKEMHQVGKGAFGTVFKAMWLGVEVAKKTFYEPSSPDFEKELSILGRLSHPSITSLLCYGGNEKECFMAMELMDGDLFSTMRRIMAKDNTLSHPFNIREVVDIMLQVGVGMEYLHEMGIVHRDLKATNILVRRVQGRETKAKMRYTLVKLADFGLSKIKENSMTYSYQTPNTGTTRWMAPEMIKASKGKEQIQVSNDTMNAKYPFRGDVYSFAMVCFEILTGKEP
jgi:predicted Ser/Thr protein kinase